MKLFFLYLLNFSAGFLVGWLTKNKKQDHTEKSDKGVEKSAPFEPVYEPPKAEDMQAASDMIDSVLVSQEHPRDDEPEEDPARDEWSLQCSEEDADEDEDEDEELDDEPKDSIYFSGNRQITEKEYGEDFMGYEKEELLYFEDVDELTFGDEDRIEDPEHMLGIRPHELFWGEEGPAYMRLNTLGMDVMVTKKPGTPGWYGAE